MKNVRNIFILSLFVLFVLYFLVPLRIDIDEKIFLSSTTFLFAIFAGFVIARQSQRYSSIRDKLTHFDGCMSFLYRSSGHFGGKAQQKVGDILRRHYKPILEYGWDYALTHKTTTLTDVHALFEETAAAKDLSKLETAVLGQMIVATRESQVARKSLVALYQERIPQSQWFLSYLLAIILVVVLWIMPPQGQTLAALVKAVLGASIVFVIVLLHKLDSLEFFEGGVGKGSAQDVLDIIEQKK